ncbi:MAG: division/cell wall cluster transcriptional repressor MraZ [Steroidobacteraceae bacterium]
MFRGATKVTLDDKGRVVIPTHQRERLKSRGEGQVVVTTDHRDACLLIYGLPDWEPIQKQIMEMNALQPQARRLQRLMVGHATDIQLDGSGRLLLSAELREYAGITRAGMLLGQGTHLELWDEARWYERRDEWLKREQDADAPVAAPESLSL